MRMVVAWPDVVLPGTTVCKMFMSALGVGDFIERDSPDIESSMALFFAFYALQVCITLIIFTNFIAMRSNR